MYYYAVLISFLYPLWFLPIYILSPFSITLLTSHLLLLFNIIPSYISIFLYSPLIYYFSLLLSPVRFPVRFLSLIISLYSLPHHLFITLSCNISFSYHTSLSTHHITSSLNLSSHPISCILLRYKYSLDITYLAIINWSTI